MKVIDVTIVLVVNVERQINFHLYLVMIMLLDEFVRFQVVVVVVDDRLLHLLMEFLLRETIYLMEIEYLYWIE